MGCIKKSNCVPLGYLFMWKVLIEGFRKEERNGITRLLSKYPLNDMGAKKAAVLLALCNINTNPGGMFDEEKDKSIQDTVVREAREELSFLSDDCPIEIIGNLRGTKDKTGTTAITPFIGYIGDGYDNKKLWEHQSKRKNDPEVADVFIMTIEELLEKEMYMQPQHFTSNYSIPVWMGPERKIIIPQSHPAYRNNCVRHSDGKDYYRIWGLTAFILSSFLKEIVKPMIRAKL
jgi:hypothetical protein